MNEIDVKNCPCYIDRPLHRYDKGCLIQSQAFSEQQTKEKPILRCDEIVGCLIKEQYKQLQQLKIENESLQSLNDFNVQKIETLESENEKLKIHLKTACKYYAPANECALTGNNCYGTFKCIDKLNAENEELKDKLSDTERRLVELSKANTHNLVLLQRRNKCLDEIEKICKENYYDDSWARLTLKLDAILQKIKEVKE